jgi:ribosomal protein L22
MTEKNYNPNQKENKAMKKQEELKKVVTPKKVLDITKKEEVVEEIPEEKTVEEVKDQKETKKEKVVQKKIKRDFAVVNGRNLPISTKVGGAIARFIKRKNIDNAIKDLEEVKALKKPIPMRGEIPHRKGKIMSGRFPKKASGEIIVLLKSLKGNAIMNDMEEPIISEVIANQASRPMAKGGRAQKKRTHFTIIAREKKVIKNKENKENKK